MFDFNALIAKAVSYELIDSEGEALFRGTADECFTALTNIYGDATVADLIKQGVKIQPVKKG